MPKRLVQEFVERTCCGGWLAIIFAVGSLLANGQTSMQVGGPTLLPSSGRILQRLAVVGFFSGWQASLPNGGWQTGEHVQPSV